MPPYPPHRNITTSPSNFDAALWCVVLVISPSTTLPGGGERERERESLWRLERRDRGGKRGDKAGPRREKFLRNRPLPQAIIYTAGSNRQGYIGDVVPIEYAEPERCQFLLDVLWGLESRRFVPPGEPCSRRAFRILLGSLRKECCQPLSFDPERRGGEGWKQQFMYGSSGWLNTLLRRCLAPLASIRRT